MSDIGWHMVAALRLESVSHHELADSSVCSSSDDWGLVVTGFGLREHHEVRERFGLQDLVLEVGTDNSLVKACESVSCTQTLAGRNEDVDSWLVLGATFGTGFCMLVSLTRTVASGSKLSES